MKIVDPLLQMLEDSVMSAFDNEVVIAAADIDVDDDDDDDIGKTF